MKKQANDTKQSKSKSAKPSAEPLEYRKVIMSCTCGAEYETGSIQETLRIDICSACHPFFTGDRRIVDAEGRVEKFRKKYALS